MTEPEQFRVDVSKRSAEEFISEVRGVAQRMVACAANDKEEDEALDLCGWADEAEQERKRAERDAWLAEQTSQVAGSHDSSDVEVPEAIDEQIGEAKAGGWTWTGEQAWMDAHLPNVDAQAVVDWLRGPGG